MPPRSSHHPSRILPIIAGAMTIACAAAQAADNGVAQKPLLGWSSWSALRGPGNEQRIKAEADAMAEKLEQFGYTYINLDSGWSRGYDNYGRPATDTSKFPGGMAPLAQYMHSKGLKLGIYLIPGIGDDLLNANPTIMGTSYKISDITDRGRPGNTLGGRHAIDFSKPGAQEYIQSCVDLFDSWGVDYIKMDFVGPGGGKIQADDRDEIKAWMTAIEKSGHPLWPRVIQRAQAGQRGYMEDLQQWLAHRGRCRGLS